MKEETPYQRMRDTVAAYFADECDGALLNGFVLFMSGQTIDDALLAPEEGAKTQYVWAVNEGQQVHVSTGLAHMLIDDLNGIRKDEP